ncbi:MAG TPA: PilZ domain-containing protein [Candidatus Omnitrophota bacterium]|nr:PilZ domain-containing protein [Candidatus Omnitrophota bacterium]
MPKKSSGTEARRHKRLNADYLLKYETNEIGEGPKITNIKNISAGGMKFLTKEIIPETSSIQVNILIPPLEKSFQACASVLRVRRLKRRLIYSVAVRFTDIRQKDQDVLDEYVKSLSDDGKMSILIDHANVILRDKKGTT